MNIRKIYFGVKIVRNDHIKGNEYTLNSFQEVDL